jgi:addiction module HigA family antidote
MLATGQNLHPASVVRAALADSGLTIGEAAERLRVSRQQLTRLLGKKSAVSQEMALRLETVFGLRAEALLEMQLDRDIERTRHETKDELAQLRPCGGVLRIDADDVLDRLRASENELRKAGIERLYLFGSIARGEARAGSDVDLFYEPSPAARIGLLTLQKIRKRIEDILGLKADLVPADSLRPHVRENAGRDAIRIF